MDSKLRNGLLTLGAIILLSSICARFLAKGETLEEYAQKNTDDSAISVDESSETSASISKSSDTYNTSDIGNSSDGNSVSNDNSDYTQIPESDDNSETSANSLRITYMDDFYYEPLSEEIIEKINGISYKENDNITLDDLRYVRLKYNDFGGEPQDGEMICNKDIAEDVVEIFYELYISGYQIEKIRLIDEYNGDDTASMIDNNTSCFNYRVVEGTSRISNHAYGLAIDLNPFYNPYITYNKDGTVNISPEGSEAYADRSASFPYKIDENDLAYKLFTAHGFKWGGNWNSVKDYQHFERSN